MIGGKTMENLLENEVFLNGVLFGFNLYQTIIITSHQRKVPLKVGDTLYYLQDGRERLQAIIDEICK